jgi:tight adherence protein B
MIASVLLTFATVFLASFAIFLAFGAARRSAELKRRLRQLATPAERPSGTPGQGLWQEAGAAERLLARVPLMAAIRKRLQFSGVQLTMLRFLLMTGAGCVAGFIAVYLWRGSVLGALLAALLMVCLPFAYLGYRKEQRSALFAEQLPEALTMIARSLRAGHSLAAAVELVSQELPEPAGALFKIAYEQQKLGIRMVDSLRSLSVKIDSMDYEFFVTIIRINIETGGNLSEILEKLADTIRSRLQIRRQVQVYTAEGRMSGYVLAGLPVVVFGVFYLLRPSYMEVFFTQQLCQIILCAAVLAQIVGFLIIRKIVDIRI